ncbi:hypothetical protein OQA88_7100 [Cercophora sp. LCS_1]
MASNRNPVSDDGKDVYIESSGPDDAVIAAFVGAFSTVWENEELWEGVDRNRIIRTMSKALLSLIDKTDSDDGEDDEDNEGEESDDEEEEEEESDNDEEDDEDDDAEMTDAIDFNIPVGITLNLSHTYLASDLEDLRSLAAQALLNLTIDVRHRNSTTQHTLTASEVETITTTFFKDMVGIVLARVTAVVDETNDDNLSTGANILSQEAGVPETMRALFRSIATLKIAGDRLSTIQNIQHNIALVNFNTEWECIKASLDRGDATGREIAKYIRPAGRGVRKISQAKAVVCEKLGITSSKFNDLYRSSHVASAMVRTFGRGAVLFLPNGISGNRGGMPYISAVLQIFMRIRRADETKVLRCLASKLDAAIVQFVRRKKAFPWDIETKNLPVESLQAALDFLNS